MYRYLLPLLLGILLSGCASKPLYPPAPARAEGASDWTYLLGPGDSVNVFVWGNPEVSGSFAIRPDGKMTMSLVEDLPATGKTPTQLAREIEKILGKYIQDPIVTVMVVSPTMVPTEARCSRPMRSSGTPCRPVSSGTTLRNSG